MGGTSGAGTAYPPRLTQWVALVEQELLTRPENMSSPPVLVEFVLLDLLCVCFVDHCLSFCPFSFGSFDLIFGV